MKRILSILLAMCMLLSLLPATLFPASAAKNEEPRVLTEEDYILTNQVWDEIRALETQLESQNATRTERIDAVADLVKNSVNYVEGSLEMSSENFTWDTDEGIACMYPFDRDEEEDCEDTSATITPENLEDYSFVSYAKRGYPRGVDVYVLGPWYAYDSSFNSTYGVGYYREFADNIAKATGGTATVYRNTAVTVDVIADCIEQGAIVMIDSHGTYAYKSGRYRNYLRLSTGTGLTDADYANGNAYYDSGYSHGAAWMITGTVISNHMEKDAPNSFVWLGICSGMRYETMHKPLLERGVESCMGYSRTISFEWDRYWLSAFTAALIEGKDVAGAAAAMKSKYGKWDRNTETAYNTLQKALNNEKAFPIFVSKEDTYPASSTSSEYPSAVQIVQTVKSTWRLYCGHSEGSTYKPATAATCTTAGNKEHYACNICSTAFADAAMTTALSDVTVPALGHSSSDGICTRCGYVSGITFMHFWASSAEAKANWTYEGSSGTSGIDTSNGGVLYSTSNGGDHYFHHTSGGTAVGHTIATGDIIEVRYRTTNVPSSLVNTTGTFELWYTTTTNDSSLANGKVLSASVKRLENTWQIAQFTPTAGSTISRLLFDVVEENKGYSGTKVEIDYVYIGPASNKPSAHATDSLLFHFDNNFRDQLRYSTTVYGDRNFDTGFWAGNSSQIGSVSYSGSAMTFSLVNGATGSYIQTTEGNKSLTSLPLNYKPTANDMIQIKLKLNNLQAVAGQTPALKLYYSKNNSGTISTADCTELMKLSSSHFNGEEFTVTAKLNDSFTAASVINALRIGLENVTNVSGKTGSVSVDYIAVGQVSSLPVPAIPCTVTFMDENGKLLSAVSTTVGGSVSYSGATPVKAYDSANHYVFAGWKTAEGTIADLNSVNGDLTVYASFEAQAHTYTEEVIASAGCTTTGLIRYSCTGCAHSYNSDPIPALGHTVVVDAGYAASCTAPGMSDGSHCSVCNEVIVAQTVIPAAGHTEAVTPGYAPTCLNSGMTDGISCSVCQTVIQAQSPIARLGHEYKYTDNGDGTHSGACIRCAKTAKAQAHTNDTNGVCTVCGSGSVTAPVVDESIRIFHSLNLASDISINYAITVASMANYDSYYLECVLPTYEGNTLTGSTTVKLQPVVNGAYYYFTLNGLTATQMNNMVDATLYMSKNGTAYCSNVDSYSVASYAYAQLDKETASLSLRRLCADLLRYGAKAQTYKNYRTDALVDAAMTPAQQALLSDINAVSFSSNSKENADLSNAPITWVGKSLDLNSKFVVKYVFDASNFSGSVENLSLKVSYEKIDGTVATTTITGAKIYSAAKNWYSFDMDSLLAAELRTVLTAAVYNGNTRVSTTMEYSADTYGNGKTGDLLTLCRALIAYSDTAKNFFLGE